ncbi:MAG: imidazoleglycerol-phosphate dehydratase HisB [Planctomycetota bacterium]|nr:imidazoleglycerol-phosphate dehydratase HisB [Planctomycetota bacterium]
MRQVFIHRKTSETDITVKLKIEGRGKAEVITPIGFLTHLLELFTRHGFFDIQLKATGDIYVDQHHTVEDIGIVLGQAFNKALGTKKGIQRAGYFVYPMQDALAVVAVDIGGRPYLRFQARFRYRWIGPPSSTSCQTGRLDSALIQEFFEGFTTGLKANIHINMPYGKNDHHKAEAIFKAFAKAMQIACSKTRRAKNIIPSTKGII